MPVRKLLLISVLVSGACLAAAFALAEQWGWALAAGAITILWLEGLRRDSPWLPGLGMWGMLAGIIVAAGSGLAFLLVLLAALGFLATWDLTRVVDRLALVQDPGMASVYTYSHLKLLGAVLAAGLTLGLAAGNITLDLPFAWLVGLTVLALILVRVAISLLQRWE
jgi:hypothetical protein